MSEIAHDEPGVLDLRVLSPETPSAVLVREVRPVSGTLNVTGWATGPLPIVQPSNDTTRRRGNLRTTDAEARRTLIAPRQSEVLYGAVETSRWHRVIETSPGHAGIVAVELLLRKSDAPGAVMRGLVAVHVHGEGFNGFNHVDALRPASPEGCGWWERVDDLLPPGLATQGGVRAVHFDDLTHSTGGSDAAKTRTYGRITAALDLESGDVAARAERHNLTIARPDWSALALRDGAAFVAHQISEEPFAPTLRNLVHSIYLDALLLAWFQRQLIDRSDDLAARADLGGSRDLVDLEREHFDFKRTYWRESLTSKRNAPSDEVFRAFQHELLTPLDVQDVEDRVRDGARLARTLQAEEADAGQERLTTLVRNATIVIGSFTLCFTAAPVITDPGVAPFVWATVAGIVGILTAFGWLWLTGRYRASGGKG